LIAAGSLDAAELVGMGERGFAFQQVLRHLCLGLAVLFSSINLVASFAANHSECLFGELTAQFPFLSSSCQALRSLLPAPLTLVV
jgi:hypothetical protein